MKEIVRIYLSENGKEVLIYDGEDNLISVKAVRDFANIGETVTNTVNGAFHDDFLERNGRDFIGCMGYEDCCPGMCDDHYPDNAGNGERVS